MCRTPAAWTDGKSMHKYPVYYLYITQKYLIFNSYWISFVLHEALKDGRTLDPVFLMVHLTLDLDF